VSGTVPQSPLRFDAVQVNSSAPPWLIVIVMSIVVRVGFTPVQFRFGQSAAPSVVVIEAWLAPDQNGPPLTGPPVSVARPTVNVIPV
jgi:hypothetical protein